MVILLPFVVTSPRKVMMPARTISKVLKPRYRGHEGNQMLSSFNESVSVGFRPFTEPFNILDEALQCE